MKQHTSTTAVEANCACIEHSPVQSHGRPPAIQQCPAPPSMSTDGEVSNTHFSSTSRKMGSSFSRSVLTALCVQFPIAVIQTGHVLFRQGEISDAVFYIAAGLVHRMVTAENGNERLVSILGPDDFCGEECLTTQPQHLASAIAVEEARIIRIEKAEMHRLLHRSSAFSDVFTAFLLSRNLKMEGALIDQLTGSVEERLRHALLALAKRSGGDRYSGIIHIAKQETLAALVGTTRPRINHLLNKFRKLGLIDYGEGVPSGEIRILGGLHQIDERKRS